MEAITVAAITINANSHAVWGRWGKEYGVASGGEGAGKINDNDSLFYEKHNACPPLVFIFFLFFTKSDGCT